MMWDDTPNSHYSHLFSIEDIPEHHLIHDAVDCDIYLKRYILIMLPWRKFIRDEHL